MRKKVFFASAFAAMLALSGCGAGTTKNTTTSQWANLNKSGLTSGLTSVISELLKSQTSEADVAGTWTYSAPKIVFESENLLNQLGGSIASSKLESMLEKQLGKIGFQEGVSQLTLGTDKKYILTLGKKKYEGIYTFAPASNKLVLQGSLGLSSFTCTATIKGNELYLLFDADKLLSFASGVAGKSSSLSSLSNLLSAYTGLKLGWTMKR